jgi:hypothetical protein
VSGDRVTAVVVNWCDEHSTKACVDSLERQDYPALTVLLVDDASPDGSGARLHARYPAIPFLQLRAKLGRAGANNVGMKRALESGASAVLVAANSTVLEPGCVRELVRVAHGHSDAGAIAPKILHHDAPDRIWFAGGTFLRARATGRREREYFVDLDPAEKQVLEATFLPACCMLVPAATLRQVGYFRDDFVEQGDDAEYGLRIVKGGQRLLYAPAARITHRAPARGTLPSAEQLRLRDRNRRRLVRLHYSPLQAARFAAWFYPTRMMVMARYALMGEMERARAVGRGMRDA